MKRILAAFARNTVFANILLALIFIAGYIASSNMIRETFPEFSLDMITISVPYPGADPEEVEEGISRKIEEAIEGLQGIKQYTTESSEGFGSANIEVREDYDLDEVLDRVRTRVNAISTFPVDAEKPVISELLLKDVVTLLYLSGDMSERRIKEWSEQIKDEIQQLPDISQVETFGARDYEIAIEVSEERLRQYGISFSEVAGAIRRSSLNLAGGTIRTREEEIRVRTMGRKYTGEELASIVVLARPEGDVVTLDRLARIDDGFTEDPIAASINGEPAVLLIVYKTPEEDALKISRTIERYIDEKQNQTPAGATIEVLYDNTDMLRARIDLLLKNGIIGLCIVFLLLWCFLNVRLSFWAGMGIPISIAGALVILWAMGGTINMISLFGLIMVLGIVVDDAIVVGEAIYVHRKQGKTALKAAVEGVSEVGMPVIAAILTTIVAFLPLFYVGGIMGKFISILPAVVIACLVVSLVECLFLLPAHLSHLPDPNRTKDQDPRLIRRLTAVQQTTSRWMERFVARVYLPFLSKALHWRYISLATAITVLMLTIGLVRSGIIKFEVFPKLDGFIMTATAEFPSGTPPETTRRAIREIEAALMRLEAKTQTRSGAPLVEDRLTLVGQTLSEMPKVGPHYGSVQAILLDSEVRGIHAEELMVQWEKEIGILPGIKSLTFAGMEAGPPGDPIEVWLQGHDMGDILEAADELMDRLRKFEGVYQIRTDFSPGKNEMRLTLKPEARALGLTVEDLARQIYAGYYGDEALRLQRGRDDIRVKVRYTADERSRLSDLDRVRIRTAGGVEVPLMSVADVTFAPGYSTITRTDGMRRVAVSAGVDTNKANANEIFAELSANYFPRLKKRHPGLFVDLQGEQKKMRESFGSLFIGFPIAVLGIFVVIATMFRSYVQPFVIMFTVPFGIIGAVFGHLLLGYDLSIMSIFGMVALTGVVVNDAIVLIERINENLACGMPYFEAILQGGARRFRAIFLTTLSTVGGLSPLILETDFQAKFLIPMALSIAAGVAFATVLTLVLIPSLLAILNDLRLVVHRVRHGRWPRRLDVEPARTRHDDPLADGHGQRPSPSADVCT
ncbi:multidrug transporter AcrB [Desulfosarcina alkanivorans]|uniref:Multidrug transporter AcrB n=1 Tax=Desulfosarcina alkanivorans TaxID=571177 RepID=A0A5K7YQ71_9BACT|nr:efflux RND transporter permease subunit [Desulfosarcina alkanivorans]BBO70483.1 multidrug transporter AcrB [Desulfosarcina alkanivorans]